MKDFGQIAEKLRRSTVQVFGSGRSGVGSGIIWDASGVILTNAHVVRGAGAHIELWDGTRLAAKMVKHDARADLAALRVEAGGLPAASLGDPAALRPGELAIAVGNPLGFVGAMSTGVIHAAGSRWVQSSVRLAPGNSGGPLANARGEVIGVNTMIAGMGQGSNLALSIPSAKAARFVNDLEGGGEIGMTVRPVQIANENSMGFLILETRPGLPADQASLMIGDLLIGASGRRFRSFSDLEDAIDGAAGALSIQFRRGGGRQDRTATVLPKQRRAAAA